MPTSQTRLRFYRKHHPGIMVKIGMNFVDDL